MKFFVSPLFYRLSATLRAWPELAVSNRLFVCSSAMLSL